MAAGGDVPSSTAEPGAASPAGAVIPAPDGAEAGSAAHATRVLFLINPASGNGATAKRWPALEALARDAGLEPEVALSAAPGDLARLARRAAEDGAGLVVAVGGDGTVHEVANGLLSAERRPLPELGLLARGTGDDFARALGIPATERDAVAVLRDGDVRALDAGRVTYRDAEGETAHSYFVSMAGVGMSGAVAARLNRSSKRLGGRVAGLVSTFAVFARWTNVPLQVRVDDERREGLMEDVLVAQHRLPQRRHAPLPGCRPRGWAVRRAAARRRHQARPRAHPAQALQRHTPAAPEGGAAARARR